MNHRLAYDLSMAIALSGLFWWTFLMFELSFVANSVRIIRDNPLIINQIEFVLFAFSLIYLSYHYIQELRKGRKHARTK